MSAVLRQSWLSGLHPLSRTIYTARSFGLLMFGAVLALHFRSVAAPAWIWTVLAGYTLLWPQAMMWLSRRSARVEEFERRALMLDAAAGGFWSALLGFNPACSTVFVSAAVMNCAAVGGVGLVLRAVPAICLGALMGAWMLPASAAGELGSATGQALAAAQILSLIHI